MCISVCMCVCSSGLGEVREYEGNLREGLRSPAICPPRYTYVFYAEAGRWSPPSTTASLDSQLEDTSLHAGVPASLTVGPLPAGSLLYSAAGNDGRDGGGNLSHVTLRWPCTSLVKTTRPQDAPHTGPSPFLHVALQVT